MYNYIEDINAKFYTLDVYYNNVNIGYISRGEFIHFSFKYKEEKLKYDRMGLTNNIDSSKSEFESRYNTFLLHFKKVLTAK